MTCIYIKYAPVSDRVKKHLTPSLSVPSPRHIAWGGALAWVPKYSPAESQGFTYIHYPAGSFILATFVNMFNLVCSMVKRYRTLLYRARRQYKNATYTYK
jgi:hypothetical protein